MTQPATLADCEQVMVLYEGCNVAEHRCASTLKALLEACVRECDTSSVGSFDYRYRHRADAIGRILAAAGLEIREGKITQMEQTR